MNDLQCGVLKLVCSALTGTKQELPNDFDFDKAYKLAKRHRIVPLLYYGIINSQINLDPEISNKLFNGTCQAIMVNQKQADSIANLIKEFEANNIKFMPLKGVIIKNLYPKAEMRNMGDVDILIHAEEYEKIVPILEKMGLKFVKENLNEYAWNDHPFYLELHRYLVSPQHKDYYKYFGDGWRFAKLADGSEYRYVMSDEDYYIYLFGHLTKHYRFSGIGLKHLVDIWVYLNAKPELDMKYIECELKKLKMHEFHENVLKTINFWFDGGKSDEITELITSRVFDSGAFGTEESTRAATAVKTINNSLVKNPRLNRLISVLFPSYKNMCKLFPIVKKVPILLPFLWLWRIVFALIFKKDKLKKQYNDVQKISNESALKYEKELEAVGLDYNFGE